MIHQAVWQFGSVVFGSSDLGRWAFLSVGAISLFGILVPAVTWIEGRRKEREAFYRAETFRRVAEASGEGARAALELLREDQRQKGSKLREGMKIGGIINVGVGLGLLIFLHALVGNEPVYLCGLIPGFIGAAMLVYVYLLAEPIE
jgi:hypothetical protein